MQTGFVGQIAESKLIGERVGFVRAKFHQHGGPIATRKWQRFNFVDFQLGIVLLLLGLGYFELVNVNYVQVRIGQPENVRAAVGFVIRVRAYGRANYVEIIFRTQVKILTRQTSRL